MRLDQFDRLLVVNFAGAERVDVHADRFGDADRIRQLHFDLVGDPRGDQVLRDVTRHVRRAAIDLRRVLAAERPAAVSPAAAVGVDDDLATGQSRVAVRPADDELAGRVDVVRDVVAGVFLGQHRADRLFDDLRLGVLGDRVAAAVQDRFVVLGADDDRVDADGLTLGVVFDRDLRLAVRSQVRQRAGLPQFRQLLHDAVGQVDRQRHQDVGFAARVTEHQSLVAGALFALDVARLVDALGDVRGLFVDRVQDAATVVRKPDVAVDVTDPLDRVADDVLDVDVVAGADLAGDDDLPGGDQRFDGDAGVPGVGVVGQNVVDDRVTDRVGHLVRVAHADRFAGKKVMAGLHGRVRSEGGRGKDV